MNGEQFYELFKDAIDRLGLDWRNKDLATVTGELTLTFSYAPVSTQVTLIFPKEETNQ